MSVENSSLLHQRFAELDSDEMTQLPLKTYVEQIIDTTDKFFTDYPGYHAIFMQVQGKVPEVEEIEVAADTQLIQDLHQKLNVKRF
ncbi:MAG: hypothetical protein V7K77_22015 [Nostoc sp.]|uniref:hypothetical protein n=1 Tax=Nostoc sp. TaxID=1180 RepID=UPI002FF5DB00